MTDTSRHLMALASEALERTRDRLAVPEHWCQGAPARNAEGAKTNVKSEDACAWCMNGALWLAIEEMGDEGRFVTRHEQGRVSAQCEEHIFDAGVDFIDELHGFEQAIQGLNDDVDTTHALVLGVMDNACTLAREELSAHQGGPA